MFAIWASCLLDQEMQPRCVETVLGLVSQASIRVAVVESGDAHSHVPGADSALVAATIDFPQALRKGFEGRTCTSSADQLVPGRIGCCVMLFKASKL